MAVIRDADRLDRHVGVAGDLGVDRHEVVLAGELHAVTGEIDEGHRIGSRVLHLLDEIAERLAQRLGIEIARPDHVETGGLQGLRDQPGIVRGGLQRAGLIGAVANHEREALLLILRMGGK
ncbi:hypothetical protein ACVW17_003775 [Bradyrhizobium sp. USDA 4473]